jgi:hypothetical protein
VEIRVAIRAFFSPASNALQLFKLHTGKHSLYDTTTTGFLEGATKPLGHLAHQLCRILSIDVSRSTKWRSLSTETPHRL